MSKTSTVIDLNLIKQKVELEEASAESFYHGFNDLNTNVNIPPLKALSNRLSNPQPGDSIELLRKEFGPKLFKILSGWAYREHKTLGSAAKEEIGSEQIDNAHKHASIAGLARKHAAIKDEESKQEFINFCADVTSSDGDKWSHGKAEKIAAIALRSLLQSRDIKDVKISVKVAEFAYTNACLAQCSKDIKRDGVLLNLGESPNLIFDPAELNTSNFPELTGEQLGFVKTLYDQGKFTGAVNSVISAGLIKDIDNPNMFVPHGPKVSVCLKKNADGTAYALSTAHYYKSSDVIDAAMEARELTSDKAIKVTMITDITALSGKRFVPGCGTGFAPTRILMTGSETEINSLSIPKTIQTKPEVLDNELEDEVTNLIPFKNTTVGKASLVAPALDDLQKQLIEYFTIQLQSGTKVSTKQHNQMKEHIIEILGPQVANGEAKHRALQDVVGSMVRACVAVASSQDPTIQLSFSQRIRHIVIDKLKSLFGLSKEQQQFKDIISGQDFVKNLQDNIVDASDKRSHMNNPQRTKDTEHNR